MGNIPYNSHISPYNVNPGWINPGWWKLWWFPQRVIFMATEMVPPQFNSRVGFTNPGLTLIPIFQPTAPSSQAGASVDPRDTCGWTPLAWAVRGPGAAEQSMAHGLAGLPWPFRNGWQKWWKLPENCWTMVIEPWTTAEKSGLHHEEMTHGEQLML